MESATGAEVEMCTEDSGQLNRNRSFKSKLLVRSQAIRESHSPPRTLSPSLHLSPRSLSDEPKPAECADWSEMQDGGERRLPQPVEIQITSGGSGDDNCHRKPELRVTCACERRLCRDCRVRRPYGGTCPAKQDSGLGCSQECPECTDSPEILISPASEPPELTHHRPQSKCECREDSQNCRCHDQKERLPNTASLTRNDSEEKRELTSEQLSRFIRDTLNKSQRDRIALLKIERELICLVNDVRRNGVRFPAVTSYGRMLVHRCAELFRLRHTLDHDNKSTVLVSKTVTCAGVIPSISFREWCTSGLTGSPQRQRDAPTKSILKRSARSLDEPLGSAGAGGGAARSKSFEQREEEYERVRRRIFSTEETQSEEQWPWLPTGPVKLLTPETAGKHNRLLKVQSLEVPGAGGGGNGATEVQSEAAGRGAVSKSHSFGGYGRDEIQPRILSRQGDLASSSWRLSPSSSGYKTLSLRSTDSVTPSPTGGISPEPAPAVAQPDSGALVWAVTDLSSVPRGALILHPQTGRPLTNPDGSVYHYDPARPPPLPPLQAPSQLSTQPSPATDSNVEQNGDRRRGRLEKQNSFIGPECECRAQDCAVESGCCCCETKTDADWSKGRCYGNDHTEPKDQDQKPTTGKTKNDTGDLRNKAVSSQQRSTFEPTDQDLATTVIVGITSRTNQNVQLADGAAGLEYQATNHNNASADSRRTDDESYRYATDYGPNVLSDTVHYALPYYQAGHQNFRINEEVQLQQEKSALGLTDPQIMMYAAGLNHNAYPYTNHCRTELATQQPHLFATDKTHEALLEQNLAEQAYFQTLHAQDPMQYQGYAGVVGATCAQHASYALDPTAAALHCLTPAQRSAAGFTYGQSLESQLPAYPMSSILLPQHNVHQYQFTTPNHQWPSWQPIITAPIQPAAPTQKPPTSPGIFLPQDLYHYALGKAETVPGVWGGHSMLQYPMYQQYAQVMPQVQAVVPAYQVCHPTYGTVLERTADSTVMRRNSGVRSYDSAATSVAGKADNSRVRPGYTPPGGARENPPLQIYPTVPYEAKPDASKESLVKPNLSKQSSVESAGDRRRCGPSEQQVLRQDSAGSELAVKLQHIKDKMSTLNIQGNQSDGASSVDQHGGGVPRVGVADTRPQRYGGGRGGQQNYPTPPPHVATGTVQHDGSQLSSAARAIVNSIRHMQSRAGTSAVLHQDNGRKRYDYPASLPQRSSAGQPRHNDRRAFGPRNHRQDSRKPSDTRDNPTVQTETIQEKDKNESSNFERISGVPDRNSSSTRRTYGFPDRNSGLQDHNTSLHGCNSGMPVPGLPERSESVPDSIQSIRREVEGRRREQREARGQDLRSEGEVVSQRRNVNQLVHYQYGRPYMFRQMSAGSWCRRSPAPPTPAAGLNSRYNPRRPPPDTRRR